MVRQLHASLKSFGFSVNICKHFLLTFCIATSKSASLASQSVFPCQTTVALQYDAAGLGEGSLLHEWVLLLTWWIHECCRHPNRFNISNTESAAWCASISKVTNSSKNNLKTRLKFSAPSRVQLSEMNKAPSTPSITSESACQRSPPILGQRKYLGCLKPEPVLTGGSTLPLVTLPPVLL